MLHSFPDTSTLRKHTSHSCYGVDNTLPEKKKKGSERERENYRVKH